MELRQLLSVEIVKAYNSSGRKTPEDCELQIILSDILDLCSDIPHEWLIRAYKKARKEFSNTPAPVHINKAWNELKNEKDELDKRSALPEPISRSTHQCYYCDVVAKRCANFQRQNSSFIVLTEEKKRLLYERPNEEERKCFFRKARELNDTKGLIECYKTLYGEIL